MSSIMKASAASLPADALPAAGLKLEEREPDPARLAAFEKLVTSALLQGDPALALLARLSGNSAYRIVATAGVSEPYDAWTARFEGRATIFFNLDLWPLERLERAGGPVLKHELAHCFLEPLLPVPPEADHLAWLERIVLDEGIAHYIGFAGDRSRLPEGREVECEQAERRLAEARLLLSDPKIAPAAKEALLKEANTGSYWRKYGAIAGMCRVARRVRREGVESLSVLIRERAPLRRQLSP